MARRWAAGGGGADETAVDLDAFGAPPEIRERCQQEDDPQAEAIGVLPEGMDAVRLFLALSTQWSFAGMDGQPTGLVYAAIEPTARLEGIEATPGLFQGLRVMEAAALAAWRERRDR